MTITTQRRRQQREGEGDITILATEGCEVFGTDPSKFDEAMNDAKKSNATIFIGGLNSTLEGGRN